MSLPTNWGYSIEEEELESLPDMLSQEEFETLTDGKYGSDVRIATSIKAAQAAIRNYIGWHLFPALSCEYAADSLKTGFVLQLPSRYVSSVESVTVDGKTLGTADYAWKTNGLLYLKAQPARKGWCDIRVRFVSGLPDSLMDAVKELISSRVSHALSGSYGVQSEAAGGLSVTYNAAWIKEARATALPETYRDTLDPYRVQGVY